jgi:glycerol-3-phosphate acyltransferase PlsY
VYTVFLRFKGGKGVATALGVFLAASPLSGPVVLVIFSLILYKWRYVSLASISAAACMPLLVTLIGKKPETVAMTIVIALIVIYKHKENIKRLRAGTENRFRA